MSEYYMTHTGAELDSAISKVKSGYIMPTEIVNIVSNVSNMDIANGKTLNVNVPVPDGYIKLADIITHTTRSASGTYTGTGTTLENITIAVGFKPKIFLIQNIDAVYSKSTASPYSLLSSVSIYRNDGSRLNARASFSLMGNSTNGYGRGGQSSNAGFSPTDNGVQGFGANVKANSGTNFNWWAWG